MCLCCFVRLVYGKNHFTQRLQQFLRFGGMSASSGNQRETSGGRRRYRATAWYHFGEESACQTVSCFYRRSHLAGKTEMSGADRSAAGFSVVSAVFPASKRHLSGLQ